MISYSRVNYGLRLPYNFKIDYFEWRLRVWRSGYDDRRAALHYAAIRFLTPGNSLCDPQIIYLSVSVHYVFYLCVRRVLRYKEFGIKNLKKEIETLKNFLWIKYR